MGEEATPSIILGRPFLATGRALIDVQKGELTLRVHNEEMVIKIFENMLYMEKKDSENCMRIDVINLLNKELQMEDNLFKSQAKLKESSSLKSKDEKEVPNAESKHWDPGKYEQLVNKEKKLGNSMNCQDNAKGVRKLWDPRKLQIEELCITNA
ncbi:hypothetical protein PIB30_095473 [Stylosanthes scabra]|uniref:Uncharacterized protein n=1 Tax=Stylosanthes scabra TaxID=79078 RepID=A0ABU6VYX5_9FABA|nr:hypothetical protein [Stylosanthes scabra]